MKNTLVQLAAFLASLGFASGVSAATAPGVFELRTYTAAPGKLNDVLARFRDHTCKIFERHGIVNVGYWVPADAKDGAGEKLVYLIAHPSREAARTAWAAFNADPEWQAVKQASEANGKIVTKVESVFLSMADFSPAFAPGAGRGMAPRVFELRTYTAVEGKLDALDTRFRDHTLALFASHRMTSVVYTHPIEAAGGAGHTLVYLLAYPSREAATAAWAAFRADPAWIKAKADSEKDGPLTTKVESVFLTPTDFSPTK